MARRRELLSWLDVDRLIDTLLPQFHKDFENMVIITRGGLVPGGLLAEALNIQQVLLAAVDFPGEDQTAHEGRGKEALWVWPAFLQFPEDPLLRARTSLVVDDVWGSGRTITAVKNRILAAGGLPELCVLHFNPYRNLFGQTRPDYYGAITDAYVVYPWEVARGEEGALLSGPERA
ncbi:MAG: phosphoribosyltransferase family protein [Anaerolineales bacterium]|jgi:hypoxanthine phosphoribosyltransferase